MAAKPQVSQPWRWPDQIGGLALRGYSPNYFPPGTPTLAHAKARNRKPGVLKRGAQT